MVVCPAEYHVYIYGTLISGRISVCFPQINHFSDYEYVWMGRPNIAICLKVGHSFDHLT